ncbi:MAG: redoxin domain-containing protein, partial [Flavobacteriales bacterium]|nr:redoxin domain-containing protein [Flavobacteriales bacterium]
MKTKLTYISIVLIVSSLFSFNYQKGRLSIEIGTKAPLTEYKMKDVSEKEYSLIDLNEENGILIIFSCNTCPFVVGSKDNEGWENRYNDLYETCKKNNIGMALVNSNEAKRKGDDSFEQMKNHSFENKYKAPYLIDKNHKLADAFGASTTPHVFLFNHSLELVYKGA